MPLSEVRSVLPVLKNPANLNRASTLTPKQFHYAFTNTLDEEASQAAYDRYAAPTPAKILFQGGFAAVTPHASTTFNFADDDRAPLLFISGGSDHILPPSCRTTTTRRTPSTPPRSPRTRCSPAATTTPAASPAGKPSPTSPSTGPSPRSQANSANSTEPPARPARAHGAPVNAREDGAKAVSCVRLDTPSLVKERYK